MACKLMRNLAKEELLPASHSSKPSLDRSALEVFAPHQEIAGQIELWQQLPSYDEHPQESFDVPYTQEDASIYSSLLRRCSSFKTLRHGLRVHSLILTSGHLCHTFFCNLLIQMYSSCGALAEAMSVFAHMPKTNPFSWNLLIGAHLQSDDNTQIVLSCFQHMQQKGVMPDQVTFVSTLSAFSAPKDLPRVHQLHICMQSGNFASDAIVGTALLNVYGKCSTPETARRVFEQIKDKNVISWNVMFAVYTQHGQTKAAFDLFNCMEMQGFIPNQVTFITLLPACTSRGNAAEAKRIHNRMLHDNFESSVNLENALLDTYGKSGDVELACSVFARMLERDVISWNVMSEAYLQQGRNDEAFYLFKQMQEECVFPDDVSCVSVISACVNEEALTQGKRIHNMLIHIEDELDVISGTALVNMYAKCGLLRVARQVFEEMPCRNIISWNAMIGAFAQHGLKSFCLDTFRKMLSKKVCPTDATYFSLLHACGHTGFVEEASYWFLMMMHRHQLTPTVEHYNCMIDLLGRAGQLDEAEAMLGVMTCRPSSASWAALLGSCSFHFDIDRGLRIVNQVIRTNPENAAPFVVLANIFASLGRWQEAERLQQIRKVTPKEQDALIDFDFWEGEYLVNRFGY
ncbi:hypothetical protein GOP47_0005794 [Adiantum capillus-veneris]|uniref:Pentatricopeptide repeat-containing protein n=1 Tax=Adiantum capillus-veneris TaxID=13818 RepID=A0A9D4V6E8_ADICA|nr:hypothetical protein GOP47_0005794 [Adiantum capillus-veneris]